jgi:hypothetical protein
MAVDTASRRFSMMNFGTVPTSPLFIPDGTVDAGDRYHLLNLYHGITLASPTVGRGSGDFPLIWFFIDG